MTGEEKHPKKNSSAPSVGTILKVFFAVVSAVIVLVAAYHGLNYYIDVRIDSKINNADFLKKLGRSIRPSLIFDEKGSILADMGAVPFVTNIFVSKGSKDTLTLIESKKEVICVARPCIAKHRERLTSLS